MFITAIVNTQPSLFKVVVGFLDSRAPKRHNMFITAIVNTWRL
jgi:hypothetical protein